MNSQIETNFDDIGDVRAIVDEIVIDTSETQGKLPTNKFMGSSDGANDDGTLNTINTNAARLTAVRAAVLTDLIDGGRLDLLIDAIPTTAMRGTDIAATEAKQDIIDGIVDNIKSYLVDGGSIDTLIDSIITHLVAMKGGTFNGATDSLEAVRDRGDAAWTTGAGGDATEAKQDTIISRIGTPANIDSGGASLAENIKKIADDNAGATFDAETDSLNKIRGVIDTVGGVAGAGAITFVYTLTDGEGGDPIGDADVWATTDEAGTNVVASGKTDQYGKVTFYLDEGTIYIWRQKSGWIGTNPDEEVVS